MKRREIKKIIWKILMVVVILATALFTALPYFGGVRF